MVLIDKARAAAVASSMSSAFFSCRVASRPSSESKIHSAGLPDHIAWVNEREFRLPRAEELYDAHAIGSGEADVSPHLAVEHHLLEALREFLGFEYAELRQTSHAWPLRRGGHF